MPNPDPDHWEARLTTRLEQHGVSDPATLVARWKAYRERAIALDLADLRSRLVAANADVAPGTGLDSAVGPDSVPGPEGFAAAVNAIIHRRMGDAETRLQTAIRQAVERIERNQGESGKSLAVLQERLPPAGQAQDGAGRTGGLGPVFVFGAATAAVVVALVLALSAMLEAIGG